MNNTKILSITLALLLAGSAAANVSILSANAADTAPQASDTAAKGGTVTIKRGTGDEGTHTYTAYEIFTGTLSSDKTKLEDIDWANTAKGADFLTALKADKTLGSKFATATDAASTAEALSKITSNSADATAFANFCVSHASLLGAGVKDSNGKISLTDDGYYVISENTALADIGTGVYTAYLLGIVGGGESQEIEAKTGLPTFQKKIMDANDSSSATDTQGDGSTNGVWQDSADYDIGDDVPFQLTATLPKEYDNYKYYTLKFHDDLKKDGSNDVYSFNKNSVKAYLVSGDKTTEITTGFTTSDGSAYAKGGTPTNYTSDTTGDFDVVFENLKTNTAVKGGDKIVVEYTAKLTDKAVIGEKGNWNGAYLEYSNNPNYEGSGEGETTPGETTPGGPHTPSTSTTPEDIVVAFTYEVDVNKVDPQANALTGATFRLEKLQSDGTYEKVGEDIKTDSDGKDLSTFSWKGVDAGTYKLTEVSAPAGYTKLKEPIEFKVMATHDETSDTPTLKSLTVVDKDGKEISGDKSLGKFTAEKQSGKISATIENKQGSTLPTTGGKGTLMFYITGGILVVAGGVYLVAKKRTNDN